MTSKKDWREKEFLDKFAQPGMPLYLRAELVLRILDFIDQEIEKALKPYEPFRDMIKNSNLR